MSYKNKDGSLTENEKSIIKKMLSNGMRNQDIQALVNINRNSTINSARITEVKNDNSIKEAEDDEVSFYIKKKESYDPQTGLNLYDDERLIRAREAMGLAVQTFNNPVVKFKTEVFAVLANIAWTYLLHEYFTRQGVNIIQKDGYSLLLSQMIKRREFPLSPAIKENIDTIIKIRDAVEHKLLGRSDQNFFPKFQACCLNFDKSIRELFGEKLSLTNEFSLALQFSKLDFDQIVTLEKYDIPEHIKALDARLNESISEELLSNLEYQFNVVFTFQSASKSRANIVFIKPDSSEAKELTYIVEKKVIAENMYPHIPSKVCEIV